MEAKYSSTFHPATAEPVEAEARIVETAEQLLALRHDPWAEDAVRVLTYPTAEPVAGVGYEYPISGFGRMLRVGQVLIKTTAGEFLVETADSFAARWTKWEDTAA